MPGSIPAAPRVRAAFSAASAAQPRTSIPATFDDVCVAKPENPSPDASTSTVASVVVCCVRDPVVDATATSVEPLVKKPYAGVSPAAAIAASASSACSRGPSSTVSGSGPRTAGSGAGSASPGNSSSIGALSAASIARAASSCSPSSVVLLETATPTRPFRTTRSVTTTSSTSVGWCSRELAKRARPDRSDCTKTSAASPAAARSAVRDVRRLAGLALAAVRQALKPPRIATGDGVQRAPELGRDARVGRVPDEPAELAVADLPRRLRPKLEVQALVVDRPALVRLEIEAVAHAVDQLLERPLGGLEVQVRHSHERHPAPAVGAHRAGKADLARSDPAHEHALADDRLRSRWDALVVEAERPQPFGRRRVRGDVH